MVAKMAMSVITIITSSRVKPRLLPLTVSGSIARRPLGCRVYIENVLATPRSRLRIVLVRALTPFRGFRHGIDRNAPQKLEFLVHCSNHLYAIDQILQLFRIALCVHLDHDESAVRRVL